MDDGPGIGALQILLVMIGLGAGLLVLFLSAFDASFGEIAVPLLIAVGAFGGVALLERHARRRP